MFTARPEISGTFSAVASTHWLASVAMLEAGGNAFDATVAAGLVLQAAGFLLNGPGSELPVIYHRVVRAETKQVRARLADYRGEGPPQSYQ